MDLQQKTRRFGAWVIACSLLLRLYSLGIIDRAAAFLSQPHIAAMLIYLETGRNVRFSFPQKQLHQGESPAPWTSPEVLPAFSPEDADAVQIYYNCDLRPDLEALIQQPLTWYLPLPEPTVLILHAHATEGYQGTDGYRTQDTKQNMISIGDHVAEVLAQHGIAAIHDRTLHDNPSYNAAYENARNSAQYYLGLYPSIQLILDLHRDALEQNGQQLSTAVNINGQFSSRLMLVMGTNAGGLSHDGWEENLSLGLKLHTQLEKQAPGITRPMALRSQRFNQDLIPGALLVEVGAAGDTHDEAMAAAEQLAKAIAELSRGTQE